jgi:hypothetical protein
VLEAKKQNVQVSRVMASWNLPTQPIGREILLTRAFIWPKLPGGGSFVSGMIVLLVLPWSRLPKPATTCILPVCLLLVR